MKQLELYTQQRIFYDKTCLRTGHIVNRFDFLHLMLLVFIRCSFLGSLYDCKVVLLYINEWTMKTMKDKLFAGEDDYVFLEWQLVWRNHC